MNTQALVVVSTNTVTLTEVELPQPREHEVLVETLFSSISPGTELRCLAGKQPDAAFPFVPGYSMIVRVIQVGRNAGLAIGTLAFLMGSAHTGKFTRAWGAHMAHAVCAESDLLVLPAVLPSSIEVAHEVPWGEHAPVGPRFFVQGSYPDTFTIPYQAGFLREMTFLMPRSEQAKDRVAVFDMLRRGALSLQSVVTDVRAPADAQRTYDELRAPGTSAMTFVFQWKA